MKWILPAVAFAIASAVGWWFVVQRQRKRRTTFVPPPTVKPVTEDHSFSSGEVSDGVSNITESLPSSVRQEFQEPEQVTSVRLGASGAVGGQDKTPSPNLPAVEKSIEKAARIDATPVTDSQIPTVTEQPKLAEERQCTGAETEAPEIDQSATEIVLENLQTSGDERNRAAVLTAKMENPFAGPLSTRPTENVTNVSATQDLSSPASVVDGATERDVTMTADQTEIDAQHPPVPARGEIDQRNHKESEAEATAVASPPVQEQTALEKGDSEDIETGDIRTPRYRAPSSNLPRNRAPRSQRTQTQSDQSDKILEVRVHARIDRRGSFQFGMLLKRLPDSPEELEITMQGCQTNLQAHGDEWYEILRSFDLATHLSAGFTANSRSSGNGRTQWALSAGRSFYILAPQQGLRGFVSTARLQLNCPQVVICIPQCREQVCNALTEACGNMVVPVSNSNCVLDGWIVFGPLTPRLSVPPRQGEDLINLLRPRSDIEIVLDGGLWLRASEWLACYPPTIRLTGELAKGTELFVDNVAATRGADETFTTPGYDEPGTHIVSCDGKSRSYTISNPPGEWTEWDAHPWCRGTICGASAKSKEHTPAGRLFTTPMSNPVLLGSEPGQMFVCSYRSTPLWVGVVPFDPIWAVPADPLHCDKKAVRVQLCKIVPVKLGTPTNLLPRKRRADIFSWCVTILNCRRKGLRIEPSDSVEIWNAYLKEARRLWRNLR